MGATRALRFVRDTRGSAGIEFAIGAVVVLGLAATGFAVYSRIETATSAPRIAITMAEYVSREKAPSGDQLDALARFLRDHELGADHAVAVATTAVRKATGARPAVLWIDRIALGDETATGELAKTCTGRTDADGNAALGAHFAMADEEIVFIVDVCSRSPGTGALAGSWGDLHHHYLLPTRHPDVVPARPARTPDAGQGSA